MDVLDRLVQLTRKTIMDSAACDDRFYLADPLSDHRRFIRICILEGYSWNDSPHRCRAVRNQFGSQSDLHTAAIRSSQSFSRCRRYYDRLGYYSLERDRNLALLQMGVVIANTLFRLGIHRNGFATGNHLLELG